MIDIAFYTEDNRDEGDIKKSSFRRPLRNNYRIYK